MINWDASPKDRDLIAKIADRATKIAKEENLDIDLLSLETDIVACHLNGTPLDLEGLLAARDGDFGHDVFGIRRFTDRETGKLPEYFLPRYARSEA